MHPLTPPRPGGWGGGGGSLVVMPGPATHLLGPYHMDPPRMLLPLLPLLPLLLPCHMLPRLLPPAPLLPPPLLPLPLPQPNPTPTPLPHHCRWIGSPTLTPSRNKPFLWVEGWGEGWGGVVVVGLTPSMS